MGPPSRDRTTEQRSALASIRRVAGPGYAALQLLGQLLQPLFQLPRAAEAAIKWLIVHQVEVVHLFPHMTFALLCLTEIFNLVASWVPLCCYI